MEIFVLRKELCFIDEDNDRKTVYFRSKNLASNPLVTSVKRQCQRRINFYLSPNIL
jgi:hypothetical protein